LWAGIGNTGVISASYFMRRSDWLKALRIAFPVPICTNFAVWFLATVGAGETQIEASFCAALRIAREQKSIPLVKTADEPTPKTAAKKQTRQEGVGSDYLFGDFLRLSAFSFNAPPAKSFTVLDRVAVAGKDAGAMMARRHYAEYRANSCAK
jgi:hypothetical protein